MRSAGDEPMLNLLVAEMPAKEREKILKYSQKVELAVGDILCESGKAYHYVYFPLSGCISLLTHLRNDQTLEIGMIGNEGMLGATLILGSSIALMRGVVQCNGSFLRVSADFFQNELLGSRALVQTMNRYLYYSLLQLKQISACAHFHDIEHRLACFLLMTHDRSSRDKFYLTHELLASMLGVRRSGITVAAGALQFKNLIRYSRGEITILDRSGLEAASCECYSPLLSLLCNTLIASTEPSLS